MRAFPAVALVVAALAAASCNSTAPAPPSIIHGTLRYADVQDPGGLNPLLRARQAGSDLDALVYGYFFELDDRLRFVPDLATAVPTYANGGISKDGLTLTYQLRHGVRWQDGAPFTSADVVFTTHAILDPKNDVATRAGWDDIASVDAAGPYAVRFHLKKIYAPAIATFFCESGLYPVLPAHLLAKATDLSRAPFDQRPVGTGPFAVTRYVPGASVELVANPTYWRGRPKLDRIVFTVAAQAAIVDGLRAHTIDAWFHPPAPTIEALRAIPGDRVVTGPSLIYTHLDLNEKDPLFDDPRVRKAIDYALDKHAIAALADGLAEPEAADSSPLSWAFDSHVAPFPFDLARSRAMLADAGFTAGPDGMLRKQDKPLEFTITAAVGAPTSEAIEALIRTQLRKVGIAVAVKNYPSSTLFAPFADGGVLYRGDYDAALFSWVAGADPDDSAEYMCDEIPPAGQNDLYWCDDALDAAERGALSTYDRATRKRYYAAVQSELASQSVSIFLFFNRQVFVTTDALRGFAPAPSTTSSWNAWEWST